MTVTGTAATDIAGKAGPATPARRPAERFELGDWRVDPAANRLLHASEGEQPLEPRAMAVLLALCEHPGEVLSADALLVRCWGDALVEGGLGDNPVHKSINQLRRALGDSATAPRYIETIRKRGYRVIAPVRGGLGQARSGAWQGGSPFRGLQAFDTRHAEVFFGREQATLELLRSVSLQMQRQHGLVLVLGPSGSGKTSLVSAGLIPSLYREALDGRWRLLSHSQLDLADLSGGVPDEAPREGRLPAFALGLAAALLDWETPEGEPLLAGFNAHDLARTLAETPAALLTELRAALHRQGGEGQPYVLLFIDRLEALFRPPLGDEAQREPALRLLQQLADSGCVLLVAACRNDYYPQLAEHPWLMRDKAQGGHLDLSPPSRAEIAQMVRLPARAAGLSFGIDPSTHQRLDDLLCDAAAASPDALPLLQYTLEQLYQQRGPHGELSFEAYQALGGAAGGMGGLEGVIAEQAEQLIRGLTPVQQAALPHVLSLLVLVGEDESSPVGGRRALWSELRSAAERELVRALVDARLLVSEHSAEFAREEPAFRVAHEALLRRWPRVTDWIAQHRQDLQTRARLRQQVKRWEQGGRAVEFLWPRGRQLLEAVALRESAGLPLGTRELNFLADCERRAAWGGRLRLGVVLALAVLAVTASWVAWKNQQLVQAVEEKRRSSQGLVSVVLGQVLEQLRPSAKLSVIESVGQQALQVLGEEEVGLSPAERLQRAKALLVIGESSWGRRQVGQAQQALLKAYAILGSGRPAELLGEWATAEGATAYWLWELTRAGHGVGRSADDWLLAYRLAIEAWVKAEPTSRGAWVEMGNAVGNQGVAAADAGDWSRAQRFLDEAIRWKQRALEGRDPEPQLVLDLVSFIQQYANVLQAQGQYAEALRHSDQALQHLRAQAALTSGEPLSMDRLARALRQRARLLLDMKRDDEGAQALSEALDLARRTAARDSENVNWVSNRWWTEVEWLNFKAARPPGLSSQAIDDVVQPLKAWLSGSKIPPDLVQRGEALVAGLQARQAWQRGDVARARQSAEASRQGWLERWQGKPFNPYLQQQLAGGELLLLQILSGQGDPGLLPLCRDISAREPRLDQAGGAVREVALIAQRCLSGAATPTPVQDQQLRAGGYVPSPLWPHFPTDIIKR